MTQATIKGINKKIAHTGMEILKGNGYFYFMPLASEPMEREFPEVDSVYTPWLRDLSLDEWVNHVEDAVVDFTETEAGGLKLGWA